jgi:hypothetical protein
MLLFIGSCKKDRKEEISSLGISELKSWYSKQILDNRTSMFAGYVPDWESSYTSSKDGYTVTEIGFSSPNKVAEITGTTATGDADKDRAAAETQVKLVFFNRPGSQAVSAAYMLLHGDVKQGATNVHYMDFGQYSGTLKYFNINGSFQNGYVISSGKVAKTITRSALTANQVLNLKEGKPFVGNGPGDRVMLYDSNTNCDVSVTDYYYETCVYIPGHPEYGTYCSYQFAYSVPTITCYGSGGGGPGGDGGYTGGGTGGGGTGSPPTAPTPDTYNLCDRLAKVHAVASNESFAKKNTDARMSTAATGNEYGYEQNLTSVNGSTYKNIELRTDNSTNSFNSNFSWNATNGYTIGDVHTHPLNSAPSPADIFGMVKNLNNTTLQNSGAADITFYKQNVSITVLTPGGNYVVTVKDWTQLSAAYATYTNDITAYNTNYAALMSQPGGSIKAILGLLGNAINLYKSDSNNVMKPMVLGSDGNVAEFNCNPGSVE